MSDTTPLHERVTEKQLLTRANFLSRQSEESISSAAKILRNAAAEIRRLRAEIKQLKEELTASQEAEESMRTLIHSGYET